MPKANAATTRKPRASSFTPKDYAVLLAIVNETIAADRKDENVKDDDLAHLYSLKTKLAKASETRSATEAA